MQRLEWRDDDHGRTRWYGAPGLWCGLYERGRSADGVYASARGGMVTFVLDGGMDVAFGAHRHTFALREGAGLLISPRTPFRYQMRPGTRLLVLDVPAVEGPGPALSPVPAALLPARIAGLLAKLPAEPRERQLREVAGEARSLGPRFVPMAHDHSTARLLQVKAHLDRRFQEPIRLADVAAKFRLEPCYLSRSFAKCVGVAPQPYLRHLRYEHFLRGLLAGRGSLLQIAHDAGFTDYPTFCRLTRRRFGVAPTGLRAATIDQEHPSPTAGAG